ncbi:MAG: hypothetical protein AVDCRST_MAG14-2806, partial [uncultured Rubrobacteraceae bacterium]
VNRKPYTARGPSPHQHPEPVLHLHGALRLHGVLRSGYRAPGYPLRRRRARRGGHRRRVRTTAPAWGAGGRFLDLHQKPAHDARPRPARRIRRPPHRSRPPRRPRHPPPNDALDGPGERRGRRRDLTLEGKRPRSRRRSRRRCRTSRPWPARPPLPVRPPGRPVVARGRGGSHPPADARRGGCWRGVRARFSGM